MTTEADHPDKTPGDVEVSAVSSPATPDLKLFSLKKLEALRDDETQRAFLDAAAAIALGKATPYQKTLFSDIQPVSAEILTPDQEIVGISGRSKAGVFRITTIGKIIIYFSTKFPSVRMAVSEGLAADLYGLQPTVKKRRDQNPLRWDASLVVRGRRSDGRRIIKNLGADAATPYGAIPPSRDADLVYFTLDDSLTEEQFSAATNHLPVPQVVIERRQSVRRDLTFFNIRVRNTHVHLGQILPLENAGTYRHHNRLSEFPLCRGTIRSVIFLAVPTTRQPKHGPAEQAVSLIAIDLLGASNFRRCLKIADKKFNLDVYYFFDKAFPPENYSQSLASFLHSLRSDAWTDSIPLALEKEPDVPVSFKEIKSAWERYAAIFAKKIYERIVKPLSENKMLIADESHRRAAAVDLFKEFFLNALDGDPLGTFVRGLPVGTKVGPYFGCGIFELFPELKKFLNQKPEDSEVTHTERLIEIISRTKFGNGNDELAAYLHKNLTPGEIIAALKPSLFEGSDYEFAKEILAMPQALGVFALPLEAYFRKADPSRAERHWPIKWVFHTINLSTHPMTARDILDWTATSDRRVVLDMAISQFKQIRTTVVEGVELFFTTRSLETFIQILGEAPWPEKGLALALNLREDKAASIIASLERGGFLERGKINDAPCWKRRTDERAAIWSEVMGSSSDGVVAAIRSGAITVQQIKSFTKLSHRDIMASLDKLVHDGIVTVRTSSIDASVYTIDK